ncbi:FAD-binding protein [Aureimonas jatrophae]|uniref:FAD-binding protein n=1 Tax=Aureimonas jatrophae TaxID=1166073 RepID=UPI00244EA15A|nr:FAD-binding protein [Aureimonas jatrophae]
MELVDVLVVGGGPAGCWAAMSALEAGASVMLVEKGYVGTGGATASGNTTIIYTARGTAERRMSVEQRVRLGQGLADPTFIERVLDRTKENLDRLADWGYPFPSYEDGRPYRGMLRGVDYLRFLRQRLIKRGAALRDQCPADGLLVSDGIVSGATGYDRRTGERWTVRAGAVVIATGGCAFLSGALGTNNLTGDGYLLGVEAGAHLSGMEFSAQYGISPVNSGVTKGVVYFWATFSDASGRALDLAGNRHGIAWHLLDGPVFAILDKASPRLREGFRKGQPNIFVPFDRMGIDPFTQRFEVTMRHEGTVRGTGGVLADDLGQTTVPGLYAVGDASSRERMSGAVSGGGGPNSSFAMATGSWAGEAAAAFASALGARKHTRTAVPAGGDAGSERQSPSHVVEAVKERMQPLDRGFFRDEASLTESAAIFETLWRDRSWRGPGRTREAEALLATARWATAAALARRESRGLQRRTDFPDADPRSPRSLLAGGIGAAWVRETPGAERRLAS